MVRNGNYACSCDISFCWTAHSHQVVPVLLLIPLYVHCSCLCSLSCPALLVIEVASNNILRLWWHLPQHTHTDIVHSVANLIILFNAICHCSHHLLLSALNCPSLLVKLVLAESSFHCFHIVFCSLPSTAPHYLLSLSLLLCYGQRRMQSAVCPLS